MNYITIKSFIILILFICNFNDKFSYGQENIIPDTLYANNSYSRLKLKTRTHIPFCESDDKFKYFETFFLGIGIFTNSTYYAFNGGYTKQLNSYLSLGFGLNIYGRLEKRDYEPPPSIDLSVLYTRTFLKKKLILLAGAGAAFFFMTTFAGIFKLKLDYNVFKNVYLGSEVQCYIKRFELYETPLVLINSTFIF